ncbi:beta-lactamase class C and other penicillin binding protein [Polaribacter sp. Hel1_85]|nr:beta-lactamase class C and other penicillin binding protein [Polaribacter sp. Hel1_85]
MTKELEKIFSRGYINGFSVAIVNKDGTLYEKGFGYSDKQANKKYTAHTIQGIASISKTFIGVALLKAQELGKLKLDDPINQYLPFKVINPHFPNTPITIRQLATHTSSIGYIYSTEKYDYILKKKDNKGLKVKNVFRLPNEMISLDLFLKRFLSKQGKWYKKKNFLKNKPGATFKYSNINGGLAAFILEKATGESFNEFTKTHIFKPLEMSNTGWFFNEVNFENHSKLYTSKKDELAPYQGINYPAGNLITSSSTLALYLSELISGFSGNGTLLSNHSYQEFFKPQLTDENYEQRHKDVYSDQYNIGVFMGLSAQGQIGHTGGDHGVVTHMFFNTKTKVGKLIIVNTYPKKEGRKQFFDLWYTLEKYENKL